MMPVIKQAQETSNIESRIKMVLVCRDDMNKKDTHHGSEYTKTHPLYYIKKFQ